MDNSTIENIGSQLRPVQDDGLPQEGLLQIFLGHRWLILSVTVLFLTAAFLYLLKATQIYTSMSRLYVEQSGPKIINEYEGVMTRSGNYLYTQGELMKSTPIIAGAVDDGQMGRFQTFSDVDNITAYVKRNLGVSVGRKDDIITVSFDSPYPAEAAQIVNAVVDSYVKYHSSRKRNTASEVLQILQKEKLKRDKELSDKFSEMLEFTRENEVVSFDNKGGNVVFERLSKLAGALTETQLATINARADFEAAKTLANEPAKIKQFAAASASAGVRIVVDDREDQLKSELRRAEMELDNARYHCTEDHPSIQAIHSKIGQINKELNEQAKEFADAYIEVMRLRWMAVNEKEDELQTSFDEQHREAKLLGIKSVEYSMLQSELNRTERICEILDDRIKELNVTEDVGALNISILEAARSADWPSKPQRARVMGMALALGLVFGCGLGLLREWLDYRLHSSEEVSAVLGIPVLGVVFTMPNNQRAIVAHSQNLWRKLKAVRVKSAGVEFCRRIGDVVASVLCKRTPAPQKPSVLEGATAYRAARLSKFCGIPESRAKTLVTHSAAPAEHKLSPDRMSIIARGQKVHLQPKSVAAEAYRTIRTAVFFGAPEGKAKTIHITSPASGDGKSTTVSNLAIAMAQAGQKTLVIDADFRRPTQHKIFDIDVERGLSGIIAGRDSVERAIQAGPVRGLDILTCGPEVPNPAEILNSDAFAKLLRSLSEQYDRIIIDSPPVGPVADAQILAATCDVVILVLKIQTSTRRHCRQARDSLVSVGANMLGAIVNGVPQKHGRYGYGYGYGHYGSYGHNSYYGKTEKKTG
jgi:capsular exopolysaccharide synthesis family protein